jgi:glycosyltransferase involved in cell wall biosynthesis
LNRTLAFLIPGRLDTRTGGYEYDRRIADGLRKRGWSVEVHELDGSFPYPTSAALSHAAQMLGSVGDRTVVLIDGLAFGAMPEEVEREAARLRMVPLIHLPLPAEVGVDRETAVRLEVNERRAFAAASAVIVTGRATLAALTSYGIRSSLITVIEPGTDRAAVARGSKTGPLQLLCVATVNSGKGHEILFRALAAVQRFDWHLTCAGSLERDPVTVQRLRARLRADALQERVSLVGELDATVLAACYDRADVFVLATMHESYGMAVAEALARGLPVVSTTTGAIPELVHPRRANGASSDPAGLLVPPGDLDRLIDALTQVLQDAGLRARLAESARRVRERLPTWDEAVDRMAAALERVAIDG